MSIANLMPGDDIEVELRYSELIVPDDGVYRFVYPTVSGRVTTVHRARGHQAEPWIAQPTLRAGVPRRRRSA
jgi:Ca-activated chloride channel family protein